MDGKTPLERETGRKWKKVPAGFGELILGHEQFCDVWMSAYDYDCMQDKLRFHDEMRVATLSLPDVLRELTGITEPPELVEEFASRFIGRADDIDRSEEATRDGCLILPGVPLAPVAGDDLAERLGLRHYPVLITATGIEQ